jgi:hypothetical protein
MSVRIASRFFKQLLQKTPNPVVKINTGWKEFSLTRLF